MLTKMITTLVTIFLTAKEVEGKSPATILFYKQNLERFIWWLGINKLSLEISNITTIILRSFLLYVRSTPNRWGTGSASSKKKASIATLDAYWRSLQAFFSWLVWEGIITAENNPINKLPRPKVPKKAIKDIPLDLIKLAINLWDSATLVGARNQAIILILLDTGIRLSECAHLTIRDIDLNRGILEILGKGQKWRRVQIGKNAKEALERYMFLRKSFNGKNLWLNKDGKPIGRTGIQIMIRRLKRLGGDIRWSPHTFRHTFALNYLRNGGDPFTLQIIGGWDDLDMPRHYCAALNAEDAFAVHRKASPADRIGTIVSENEPAF